MENAKNLSVGEGHDVTPTVPDSPYIHAATSDNTRIAYQADIQHFLKSGGTLPATPEASILFVKQLC